MTIFTHSFLQKKANYGDKVPRFQLFFTFGTMRKSEEYTFQDFLIHALSKSRDQHRTQWSEDASEDEKSDDDKNCCHVWFLFEGKWTLILIKFDENW